MTNNKKIQLRFSVITMIIFAAAFSRIIPHIPNFSPLGAIGLFGAAYFSKKWHAFLIPILATWISDLFINNVIYGQYYSKFVWFYEGFYWQYGSYLLITFLGMIIFQKINFFRVFLGAWVSSALFFLISNFGCWIGSDFYPQNFEGLMICYAAGLPFLKGTLMGDLFYTVVLFGTFELAQKKYPFLSLSNVR